MNEYRIAFAVFVVILKLKITETIYSIQNLLKNINLTKMVIQKYHLMLHMMLNTIIMKNIIKIYIIQL